MTKIPRTELLIKNQKTSTNCLTLEQTYHPTIVPINKAVMKEWKRYSNMPTAKHLFSSTTLCVCRQPPNLRQMLVKTRISTTPTITGNKKCMKSRCLICNIFDTRPSLKIPGTNITVRPGNYYCNSSNVIYLIKCKKCDSGNYRKIAKYVELDRRFIYQPAAVETSGAMGKSTIQFFKDLGRRLAVRFQDQRESDFLFPRVSLAILRGNAISILLSYRD